MKRDLFQWGHGSSDDEKVVSDIAAYTGGKIQLDLGSAPSHARKHANPNVNAKENKAYGIVHHRRRDHQCDNHATRREKRGTGGNLRDLLTDEPVRISNVPDILDVNNSYSCW